MAATFIRTWGLNAAAASNLPRAGETRFQQDRSDEHVQPRERDDERAPLLSPDRNSYAAIAASPSVTAACEIDPNSLVWLGRQRSTTGG